MVVELLSVAAVFLGGCAAARAAGITGWALPAFGMVAGVCLQLAVGLVQVVTPLTTSPLLTLAVTLGAPVAWWVTRWRRGHDVAVSVRLAAVSLAALAAAVALLRVAYLAKWHTDSYAYLMAGSLLADDRYASDVATRLLSKRTLGVPLLHAPANLGGDYFLTSIHALLAAAVLACVVWFFRRGMAGRVSPAALLTFAALGGALLVTNNRFVFSAFYLNGHLLVAGLVLVIAAVGWLLATRDRLPNDAPARALMMLQIIAIPALVVTRPEGTVLAGLALLPMWLSARVNVTHRMVTVAVLGASNTLWQGFGVWLHLERGVAPSLTIAGSLVLGVLLILAVPLLRLSRRPGRRLPDRVPVYLLWIVEAGLWLAVLAMAVRSPDILFASVEATVQNVVFGAGRWGVTLLVLAGLVVAAMVLRTPYLTYLRFPITTFLPVALLLAYLRDTAYRVGYGDSLSRMFMHLVPLAVLYLIAAMADQAARPQRRQQTATPAPVAVPEPEPEPEPVTGADAMARQ